MKTIPTPNSFQYIGCEGSCENHRGEVRRVEVKCQGHPNGTWGIFRYCEEAIEEDKRRGLNPIILENNEMRDGGAGHLEKEQEIMDTENEQTDTRGQQPDVPPQSAGYRVLNFDEVIKPCDQFLQSDGETWIERPGTVGEIVDGYYAVRRPLLSDNKEERND